MAANELKEFEKALSKIPKHLVDWKGLREWSSSANKNTKRNGSAPTSDKAIVRNVELVSIPSIGEFERLLYQVSPPIGRKAIFNENDLVLLKISKDLTILFYQQQKTNITKNKQTKNENKEKKSNTQENTQKQKVEKQNETENTAEAPSDNLKSETKLVLPKLAFKEVQGNESVNDSERIEKKFVCTLSMNLDGEFNCLLIGAGCCCTGASAHIGDNKMSKKKNDEMILDLIFDNILKYVGKMISKEEIDSCKDEIKGLWSLIFKLLNWKNENDEKILMVRLAMILFVSLKNFSKLSFVQDFIKDNNGKEKDAVVTGPPSNTTNDETSIDVEEECMFWM